MADEEKPAEEAPPAEPAGGGGGDGPECPPCPKCEICVPGLPGWMATFSDLVTLLLTFFVLLLSFAKTETAKYEAALGSVRNAFGGNVFKQGEVIQPGKSPDDSPEMVDAQEPIKPFPIEFLTLEGLLDKHEINRESRETLKVMRTELKEYNLTENVTIEEIPEGIKVTVKDKIYFEQGSVRVVSGAGAKREVLDRMVDLISEKDWKLFIQGHASKGEVSLDGSQDAFTLSSIRAAQVARLFIKNKVAPENITTVFYGDTRPDAAFGKSSSVSDEKNRRVEFILRKTDLSTKGHKVDGR